jgi:hypothetical protein
MFEDIPSLSIANFFAIKTKCYYVKQEILSKKYMLLSTAPYLQEEKFCNVYMGWHEDGLIFNLHMTIPFTKVVSPNFKKGDAIELFFDTRNMKDKSVITKFCHHFVFFPKQVDDKWGMELTRFRVGDMRPLSTFENIRVDVLHEKNGYLMKIFMGKGSLYGFDPINFHELGFTYRINRFEAMAQHFAISSEEYNIEKHPDLWASLILEK